MSKNSLRRPASPAFWRLVRAKNKKPHQKNIESRSVRFILKPLISIPNSYLKKFRVPLNAAPYAAAVRPSRISASFTQAQQEKNNSLPQILKTRRRKSSGAVLGGSSGYRQAVSLKIRDQNIKKFIKLISKARTPETEGNSHLKNKLYPQLRSRVGAALTSGVVGCSHTDTTKRRSTSKAEHQYPSLMSASIVKSASTQKQQAGVRQKNSSNNRGGKVHLLYLLRLISEKGPFFVKGYHKNILKKNKFLTAARDILMVKSLNTRYLNLVDPVLNKT